MNWAAKALAAQENFYNGMNQWTRIHWDEADFLAMQPYYERPVTTRLELGGYETVEIPVGDKGLRCIQYEAGPGQPGHSRRRSWIQCKRGAGQGTDHEGVGLCYMHDGWRGRGQAQGAILMAHAYGDELNISPWQALLQQVRMLYGQVYWLQQLVLEAETKGGSDALRPGGSGYDWVVMLEERGNRLARVSAAAISAGVAKRLMEHLDLEAKIMFQSANAALDSIEGITNDQRERALAIMAETARTLEIAAAAEDAEMQL